MAAMIDARKIIRKGETAGQDDAGGSRTATVREDESARWWDEFDDLLCRSFGPVSPAYLFISFPPIPPPVD